MIVIVCGGRGYNDYKAVQEALDQLRNRITILAHGDALGADSMADSWALENATQVARFPADWESYKMAAGPIRNRAMLLIKPDLVIAFPGGAGTADMVKAAQQYGVAVWKPVACPSYAEYTAVKPTIEGFFL